MDEETQSQGPLSKPEEGYVEASQVWVCDEANTNMFSKAKPESRCELFWYSGCVKSYSGFSNFILLFISSRIHLIPYKWSKLYTKLGSCTKEWLNTLKNKFNIFIARTKWWQINSVE